MKNPAGGTVSFQKVALQLHPDDDVAIAKIDLQPETVMAWVPTSGSQAQIKVRQVIPAGHKIALRKVAPGDLVRKYGQVIGRAVQAIGIGQHVHDHNLEVKTLAQDYAFGADASPVAYVPEAERRSFRGYQRGDGRVGTRNLIAIISSVHCSANACRRIARHFAAALSTMVPCAARLAVIFGLVAFYLGPWHALGIYLYNLFVIAATGRIITRYLPEDSPGLILEMPVYRLPTIKTVTAKAWFRIREFIFEAWPVLIVGSIILAVMNYYSITQYINSLLQPFNQLLGLPPEVGTPLIFGIFRKELSLIMLAQAFGTSNYAAVMNAEQMIVFTIFVVFYIPCFATMLSIRSELGQKAMWQITALTVLVATIAALIVRLLFILF